MWNDDARLSVHMYGDADNFILLSINQEKETSVGAEFSKSVSIPLENATPESVGTAFSNYLREHFWRDAKS